MVGFSEARANCLKVVEKVTQVLGNVEEKNRDSPPDYLHRTFRELKAIAGSKAAQSCIHALLTMFSHRTQPSYFLITLENLTQMIKLGASI